MVLDDACHLRQIYYGQVDDQLILTSSVKMFLDYSGYKLQISQTKLDFIALPKYSQSESSWYGSRSIDDRLSKLLPNHYLDQNSQAVKRMPFLPQRQPANDLEIMDYASRLSCGELMPRW